MLNGASASSARDPTAISCRSHAVSEVMNARLLTINLVALKVTALSKVDLSLDNVARAGSAQRVSQSIIQVRTAPMRRCSQGIRLGRAF